MKKVVHFEIPADNIERAKKFYSIFDWKITEWPLGDGQTYVSAQTVEVDEFNRPKEAGAINGGIAKRDGILRSPQVTVNVPSIDEYIRKVEAAGGKLLKPKQNVNNMGYYAYVTDTEGNLLGLWEDIKQS